MPKTIRRMRGHFRERHSSKTRTTKAATAKKIALFLKRSDTAKANVIGCGSAVPEVEQTSFSFGTTNVKEPNQKKNAGKTRAEFFR